MFIQKILPSDNRRQTSFKAADLGEVIKLTTEISKKIYGKKTD